MPDPSEHDRWADLARDLGLEPDPAAESPPAAKLKPEPPPARPSREPELREPDLSEPEPRRPEPRRPEPRRPEPRRPEPRSPEPRSPEPREPALFERPQPRPAPEPPVRRAPDVGDFLGFSAEPEPYEEHVRDVRDEEDVSPAVEQAREERPREEPPREESPREERSGRRRRRGRGRGRGSREAAEQAPAAGEELPAEEEEPRDSVGFEAPESREDDDYGPPRDRDRDRDRDRRRGDSGSRRAPAAVEEEEYPADDDLPPEPLDEEEPEELGGRPPAVEEDDDEVEDLSTWEIPSWQELIASLYRPDR